MKNLSKIILVFTILVSPSLSFGFWEPETRHDDEKERLSESRFLNYWKHKNDYEKEKHNPYRNVGRITCDKYPRVCQVKGSTGRDCCKKKCVDVRSDRLNCGMCGNKCKYPEVCCKGTCVNPLHDKKHCGSCGNKCRRGSFCNYGMCSYA